MRFESSYMWDCILSLFSVVVNTSDSKPDNVGSIPTMDVLYVCKFLVREVVLNAEDV